MNVDTFSGRGHYVRSYTILKSDSNVTQLVSNRSVISDTMIDYDYACNT
jgi:hypothetical protein